MRKVLTRGAMLLLIAISSFTAANSQALYATPRAVNLDSIVRRMFPSYYGRPYPGGIRMRLYTEGFYPIGWSRDGKFAYYTEPVDEACGCYFAELVIQDLRTDQVLWKFKNDPDARVDAEGAPLEDDVRKLWKRNQKEFSAKLREHGIVAQPRFALLGRTFTSGGRSYTAKIIAPRGKDDDGSERVKSMKVEFSSPALGKKTLFTADYSAEMFTSPLDVGVAGSFKSPYENRAAVIVVNVQRGWEGPPHTVNIQIAGADLRTGFRKP